VFGDLTYPSFVFWPVGCGDSTTIPIVGDFTLQIDINDGATADNTDNERIPVVDELVAKLPRLNGKPYLSCFALTHPDLDHVKGFKELLKRVVIGELWFTPRVFWEYKKDLSPDALAFCEEAQRRVKHTIAAGGDPGRGHRVRLIGYDDLLGKDDYRGFPRKFLTIPGQSIEIVDGQDLSQFFSAFVHAPFKDDSAGERNETSLALQVRLYHGRTVGCGLFFGDLSYPTIRRIFDETHRHNNDDRLVWDVHLSSHHCSKKVMYVRNQDGSDVLMQDILDELNAVQADGGCIVASSSAFPASNSPGDNPPHIKARRRYEEIAIGGFICTGEYSTPENMRPVVFSVTERGVIFVGDALELSEESRSTLAKAVAAARGTDRPPTERVGFGRT
jgi:hypothetical protein